MIRITLGALLLALLPPCAIAQSCNPRDADLRHANVPASVKNDMVTAVANVVLKEFGRFLTEPPTPQDIALSSCTSFPKLAQSGNVILLTQGPDYPREPGGASFDAFWLFRQTDSHAVLILTSDNYAGTASKAYHNGMLDVEISAPDVPYSGVEHNVIYRFNGKRYVPLYCYKIHDDGSEGPERPCSK